MPLVALLAALSAILGQPVPDWPVKAADHWVQGGPLDLAGLRGKVVLIRFFTGTDCPYCSVTAPALNEFHRELGPRGLVVIGMYTPKPQPRAVPLSEVRTVVDAYGFTFPVALDEDWGALRRLWLDRVPGATFTSASLLLDRQGRLRHVHEGGAYAPDATDPQARKDFDALRKAIVSLLAER
jgi:peroxiredoxin